MLKFGDDKSQLKCSLCGKLQEQVRKLVAGPGVYICDECIELCNEIIEEEQTKVAAEHGFKLSGHSLVLYGICDNQACKDNAK